MRRGRAALVLDREADAVFVEAVNQAGFVEGGSW